MKNKTSVTSGLLMMFMLVASIALSARLVILVPAKADPGVLEWSTVQTPGSFVSRNDILFRSEIDKLVVSHTGNVLFSVVTRNTVPSMQLFSTGDGGRSWGGSSDLLNAMIAQWGAAQNVWDVAIAPDDLKFWVVVSSSPTVKGPVAVWITMDGGDKWENTNLSLPPGNFISCIDVSMSYQGMHDIAIGTRNAGITAANKIYVFKTGFYGNWNAQDILPSSSYPTVNNDVIDVKFSPTYSSDSTICIVYSANTGVPATDATYFLTGIHDSDLNSTTWNLNPIEVKDPISAAGASPDATTIVTADLELPSDFSGQAASLRRAYISFYSNPKNVANENGIYRIDDSIVYELMDTTSTAGKDISSIAFYGTYASGKLLAGEVFGHPCTATVMTWFTDSPTTCPIPCWYPALKPTTGSAGVDCLNATGYGNAQVGWSPDGKIAFTATGSACLGPFNTPNAAINCAALPEWPDGYLNWISRDESAFAISRNNGETWNQLSLIDTRINRLTDVAPSQDCTTLYLASSNTGTGVPGLCDSFDSIWRSSINRNVTTPLAATPPLGYYWERVFTHVTAADCTDTQTNMAILRLVPYCADPTGETVGWAVYDPTMIDEHGVAAWSPDFGDYWAMITVRNPIQDLTFESRTILYFLSPGGLVQKMPYTGSSWSTAIPGADSMVSAAHTIAAYPEGKVLVGGANPFTSSFATSYSANMNTDSPTFGVQYLAGATGRDGNIHVAFDTKFDDTGIYFIAEESTGLGGSVYRNSPSAQLGWTDTDMLAAANGAVACPSLTGTDQGHTGIVLASTGEALYTSSQAATGGVWRTIDDGTGKFGPLSGMPKPGIAWDCLSVFTPSATTGVLFTLQPTALKACGCCTLSTNTILYAIDNRAYDPSNLQGMLWGFTDCLAKRGPELVTEAKALIGCDQVSGRAQEVNLCWEQLCLADAYDIEIAKVADFSIRVIDWVAEADCTGFLVPADVTIPCAYIPAGGTLTLTNSSLAINLSGVLECGHTYWWRVKARRCANGQIVRSPWSEVRSFTIKAGLPVTTTYYGPQLLAPNNGCLGCPVKPVSFSWSPFKETTKYKFVLAKDAAITQIVKEAEVTTTAFEYDGTLDYGINYFWRVMALEPAPSDWSATFSFQTRVAPATQPGTPSKVELQNLLTKPIAAIYNWIAAPKIHLTPARPHLLLVFVVILISIALFIAWLIVMIAISKLLRR